MDALLGTARDILGLTLKSEEMGVGQMCARALLFYIALIAIVRFGKKRFLGKATVFDAILVIIIGSVAARAITGGAPLFPSLGAEVLLVAVHWLFSALACRSQGFGKLIKGTSTIVVENGAVRSEALAGQHMSEDDLAEDLRQHGVSAAADVKEARLERSGHLSVLKK
jgi:uncharacterized membrane protein YcaP (DUF421 family)